MSGILRWRTSTQGRQFWCYDCKGWVSVPPDGSIVGQRRAHAEEHTAEGQMFARLDLMELDAQLDGWYGP